jgi:hypothetical protein
MWWFGDPQLAPLDILDELISITVQVLSLSYASADTTLEWILRVLDGGPKLLFLEG